MFKKLLKGRDKIKSAMNEIPAIMRKLQEGGAECAEMRMANETLIEDIKARNISLCSYETKALGLYEQMAETLEAPER